MPARILAKVAQLVLVTPLLLAAMPAAAGLADFLGDWRNIREDDRGVIRVAVARRGDGVILRIWGRCHPTPCDWGEARAELHGDGVSSALPDEATLLRADYDPGFSRTQVILTKLSDGRLRAEVLTRFTDDSGRASYWSAALFERAAGPP